MKHSHEVLIKGCLIPEANHAICLQVEGEV